MVCTSPDSKTDTTCTLPIKSGDLKIELNDYGQLMIYYNSRVIWHVVKRNL